MWIKWPVLTMIVFEDLILVKMLPLHLFIGNCDKIIFPRNEIVSRGLIRNIGLRNIHIYTVIENNFSQINLRLRVISLIFQIVVNLIQFIYNTDLYFEFTCIFNKDRRTACVSEPT